MNPCKVRPENCKLWNIKACICKSDVKFPSVIPDFITAVRSSVCYGYLLTNTPQIIHLMKIHRSLLQHSGVRIILLKHHPSYSLFLDLSGKWLAFQPRFFTRFFVLHHFIACLRQLYETVCYSKEKSDQAVPSKQIWAETEEDVKQRL